eukprot:gnl/Dysnectes_brevis/1185_a1324_4331.p1 GENE.gnl/Dysnectes_brevis/1185_a1324_4331~~gnl/Dysnectes_brevis/1185_a1324_4331.p1  ORF type:complete len:133 (+),score=5.84 gnl/Dysnectes_brevis/1185_a1324_4331:52-450(+)
MKLNIFSHLPFIFDIVLFIDVALFLHFMLLIFLPRFFIKSISMLYKPIAEKKSIWIIVSVIISLLFSTEIPEIKRFITSVNRSAIDKAAYHLSLFSEALLLLCIVLLWVNYAIITNFVTIGKQKQMEKDKQE